MKKEVWRTTIDQEGYDLWRRTHPSMIPQNITSRYTRNLVNKGHNNDFVLISISRRSHVIDDIPVGYYYLANVTGSNLTSKEAVGATPGQAVERALTKHGVTFR